MNNRWRLVRRLRSRYQVREACEEIIAKIANYNGNTELTYNAVGGLSKIHVGDLLLTRDQILRYWDEDMDCSCGVDIRIDRRYS